MKVGDLVRLQPYAEFDGEFENWTGLIIGFRGEEPVVHWNDEYPHEVEYVHQIEVIEDDQIL